MKKLKNSLSVRGDSLYCPLAFSLDSYGNCLTDCHHCWIRHLNHTWGDELKPLDVNILERKLMNGLKNKKPITSLSYCLTLKKTIRWGNKTDPFQKAELDHKIAPSVFSLLIDLDWTFVIQTRFTHIMMNYESYINKAKSLITIMPVISPGLNKDWETFERKRTTPPINRLEHLRSLQKQNINIGVNGEPFIPGFHEVKDFEKTLRLLKHYKIPSYNVYNFHFNPYVAKRLHSIGIDIEKIWYYNQDSQWKKILPKLLDLSKKYNIRMGCPDFVNSGWGWEEKTNTCCGVKVQNPTTFNTHHFKRLKQDGISNEEIINQTYDGSGDFEQGLKILKGNTKKFYTLKNVIK